MQQNGKKEMIEINNKINISDKTYFMNLFEDFVWRTHEWVTNRKKIKRE